ncbi:MAG: CocE/NonD family hydrolase, partial [Acidobacteriaceae bacterium]|nr:CocE/NonD family hydrolase [Acidobacteriaceae bacterium]
MNRNRWVWLCLLCAVAFILLAAQNEHPTSGTPKFNRNEIMVPMRDGVHLQTAIFTPVDQHGPLPILLLRTPYGVPEKSEELEKAAGLQALIADGYILVYQNLRGRFQSEGTFRISTTPPDKTDPKATSESSDAYDTIDWLVKNVANNNGKVGIFGVSYSGLTSALALLEPHPALKAISEQASPADQWMNDDFHRYGAFRLSYGFEYSVMEEASKTENTHFNFDVYDTYQWYLNLGPLSNANLKYLHGQIGMWNKFTEHPNYDAFWNKEAFVNSYGEDSVPILNVAGWWDQEDPQGPWTIYAKLAQNDPKHNDYMVGGPWNHGGWRRKDGSKLGLVTFGGHNTSAEYRENVEAPWFRYWLHGQGERPAWAVQTFETGSNQWRTYSTWPPANARETNVYLQANGGLAFDHQKSGAGYAEYVSDPGDPVPYRKRPISPTYPGGDWPEWEVQDQRFVEHRPDVLTFESAPLDHDLRAAGEFKADLFASTSGTDSDWVVKLIDAYPENYQANEADDADEEHGPAPGQYAKSMNGYELTIAAEVMRARFRNSFDHPEPLTANKVTEFKIPLRSHDHVFLKGHRIMVQVQSSWFPL